MVDGGGDMLQEFDTTNRFLVGRKGAATIIVRVPVGELSAADALNLAAWLVALNDDAESFPVILAAVLET